MRPDDDNNPFGVLIPNYGNLRVWGKCRELQLQRPASLFGTATEPRPAVRRQLHLERFHRFWIHWHSGLTTANGFGAGDGYTTDQTLPHLDRGNSTFDIRHRLTFNFVWEMPFLRNRHDFLGTMLAGWQLNGIFSLQTGAHWFPYRGGGGLAGSKLQPDASFPDACDPATFNPTHCVNVRAD